MTNSTPSSLTRTISWVILTLVGALTFLGSLASARLAYRSSEDIIGKTSLADVAGGREDVASALRARRGTSAAYAAGYAVLFLFIVLVPYRRGDVWSWWALLAGVLVVAMLVLARVPFLGTRLGAGAAWLQLGIVGAALLLDVKRVLSPSA
jgi:cell division protein FtsW (lipid II flippase)